jgi:ssDNA-binding Zn-finger/Zn-ribbon topoisomerase 1
MDVTELLAWTARGFHPVTYIELTCPDCGTFRTASPEPLPSYPCPKCRKPIRVRVIADGVTRSENFTWECIEKPYRFGRNYHIKGSQKSALAT